MQLESKPNISFVQLLQSDRLITPKWRSPKDPEKATYGSKVTRGLVAPTRYRDLVTWQYFFLRNLGVQKKKMMRIWRSILSHIWSSKKRSRSQTRGFHTTEDRLGDATLLLLAALLDWPCWSIMPALVTWLSGLAHSNLQTLNVHNLLTPWAV